MGIFDRIFGGKGGKKPDTPPPPPHGKPGARTSDVADSVEKLDSAIELLEKKEQVLEKKVEQELEKAKELLSKKNKSGALACMKRKKMYEDQIVKLQAQKDNMETMRFAIQEQAMNHQVLEAQRRAGQQLQTMNAGMNAERVEDDMDAIREAMDQAQEVSSALTQPIDNNPVDEDELMAELEQLGAETAAPAAVKATAQPVPAELTGITVPSASLPQKKPVVEKEEEDHEALLRELEAQLNA